MSLLQVGVIVMAAVAAGMINTIVGSGSLITFPTLILLGYPPVPANMSNSLGMVAGGVAGAVGYRDELRGHSRFLRRTAPVTAVAAAAGAGLLLVLPSAAFNAIVPALVALSVVLVLIGPRVQAAAKRRRDAQGASAHDGELTAGIFGIGLYGGYFGAAQGIMLMGLLSALSSEPIQRLNGYKNVLAAVANFVAAVVFVVVAPQRMQWEVVGLIAVGAFAGGLLGAHVGRRLSPPVLRGVIVTIGVVAIIKLVIFP